MSKVIPFEKSFASHEKAKFWSEKNEVKPTDVLKSSNKKYWFDCECSHSFNRMLYEIIRGNWCPYCSNKKLCDLEDCKSCFEKSFASSEKAKYWSKKNEVKPRDVLKGSDKKLYFNCECGHTFNCRLANISTKNSWCPYCSNKKLCDLEDCKSCFEKSFASSEKAKYWSEKNEIKPRDVFKSSGKTYWFNCDCMHSFDNSLDIIYRGIWCPYCSNPPQKLCDLEDCKSCFEKSFASSEKAKYWSKKNEVNPRDVFKSSNNKYWFDCECGHQFDSNLQHITKGSWCPYCSNHKLCDLEDCQNCFQKSFASHENAKYWSYKNKIKPRYIFRGSHNKYWFNCECGHTFNYSLGHISNGLWCPYCSNHKLCDSKDCKQCFEKSFASSEKAKYWSEKNEVKPRDVFKNSNNKYLFICKCSHQFDSNLGNICNGKWCPYCSNPPHKLCDLEDCKSCFEKSFASTEKAKYWSEKNEIKPRYIFKNSNNKYWFNCDKQHIFYSCLNGISNGCWCPYCINKTEQKVYEQLIIFYRTLQQQYKVEWCKKKSYLPFDFVIPEHNIIIELDGRQHFTQVSNWSSPEEQQINDKYKMDCANKHNYSVIRLLQEDVFYDTYNWLEELNENIKKIIEEKNIQNIYMCKNNEYDIFANK